MFSNWCVWGRGSINGLNGHLQLIVPFLERMAKTLKPWLWWRYMERDEESQICFWLGLRPGGQIPGKCIDGNRLQGDGSDPGYPESTQLIPRSCPLVYHLLHLPFVTSFPPSFPAFMELLREYPIYLRKEISFFLSPPFPFPPFFFLRFMYWSALRIAYPSYIDSLAPSTACSPSPPLPSSFFPFLLASFY